MQRQVYAPAILLVLGSTSAQAVTDIRFERWVMRTGIARDTVAPVDTVSLIEVSFDATTTATDIAQGFSFALAEKDGSSHDVLVRFELAPCVNPPAVGSEVVIAVTCRVSCDSTGTLHASGVSRWDAQWCNLPTPRYCGDTNRGDVAFPATSDPEDFEFVLLDENDQEGSFPTPEDIASCGSGPVSGTYVQIAAPDFPESGTIGIFADPAGTMCAASVSPSTLFHWYVVLRQEGVTRCGISVAEFGIRGVPPELILGVRPNPTAIVSLGTVYSTLAIGWGNCGQGDTEALVLYTLDGILVSPVSNVFLSVEGGNPPSNSYWPYPWADICPLGLARRRLHGSEFVINPSPGHPCFSTVGVETKTWSAVKSLYSGK